MRCSQSRRCSRLLQDSKTAMCLPSWTVLVKELILQNGLSKRIIPHFQLRLLSSLQFKAASIRNQIPIVSHLSCADHQLRSLQSQLPKFFISSTSCLAKTVTTKCNCLRSSNHSKVQIKRWNISVKSTAHC